MRLSLTSRPVAAFPNVPAGRLPHSRFRGLLSVHSRCGPHGRWITLGDPLHRSASNDVVTSIIRSDCYRLERQFAGRDSHPLRDGAFPRHTVRTPVRANASRTRSSSSMMVVFTCGTPDLSVSVCVFYVARSHSGGRGAVENARRRGWAGQYRSDGPGWGAPGDDGVAQGAIAVDEITLRNYRCFRDEQIARLAPLTLLVGENSTGKTSFMAMIRALWDAAYRSRVPNFKEEPYDLGSFDEIAHHRGARGGRAEEIHSGFSASPRAPRRKGKSTTADGTPARFAVTFHRKGTTPIPRTRRLPTVPGSRYGTRNQGSASGPPEAPGA